MTRNWTIGRRIAAGYAVLIVLLVATAVVAIFALRASREDFTSAVAHAAGPRAAGHRVAAGHGRGVGGLH